MEEGRHAGKQAGGWGGVVGGASSRETRTVEAEGRARAERTPNMAPMLVTLDVSKLSGWLNASASCRVQREGMLIGRQAGQETEGRGGGGLSDARRGPDW